MDTTERSIPTPTATVDPVPINGSGPRVTRGEDIDPRYAGIDVVNRAEDVDYERHTPKPISAARLNEMEPKPHTFMMRLHQTSINIGEDAYAEVRIVNLTDRALIGTLPANVRKLIERLFFSGTPSQRGLNKSETRMNTGLKRFEEICYAYGCAGFVSPRLVLRPEDVTDPENEVWVGSGAIALHDLSEFNRICEGDDQLAARRLEGFSE